jgi:hypothetical protein
MHRITAVGALLLSVLLLASAQQLAAQSSDAPHIRLKSRTFDPHARTALAATPAQANTANQHGLFLIQFNGPVQEAWKTAVQQTGVRLYGYVPDYTFIARLNKATPEQLQQLPFVRWVGPYLATDKLDVGLANVLPQSNGAITVDIQTLPDADLAVLQQQIEAWHGKLLKQARNDGAGSVRAELSLSKLNDLAQADGVVWIEPYIAPSFQNNIAGGLIMRAEAVRSTLGLYGNGQIVGVADSGLDTGNSTTLHPDVRGRVRAAYCLGRPSPCSWSDTNGHGTHVVGSVLGNGSASGSNPVAHSYTYSQAGVAPEAELVLQSIGDNNDGLSGIPVDAGDLLRQAYKDGARLHSNSWGGQSCSNPPTCTSYGFGAYAANSRQVDYAAWQYKDLLVLFAAGNAAVDVNKDGVIDPDSMSAPGTAKNVLTVGASENERPDIALTWGQGWPNNFQTAPLANDQVANNKNGMAAFSGRGPTDDGRIKPDVVAPGTYIVSMRSRATGAGTGWGVYNQSYVYNGGTSMSTPLAAGAAAIAREWLVKLRSIANPSAALVKAMLLNGAANMSPGQYGSTKPEVPAMRPNNVAGWGRVDLLQSLDPPASQRIWLTDNTSGITTGDHAQYMLNIGGATATNGPMRVMLTWTDYPGEPAATKALVNDLDLEIVGPDGKRYQGNQGVYATGHRCLRSDGADTCNNAEGVVIPQAQPGTYTVTVRGANVAQGGRQPFALVATGNEARAVYSQAIFVPFAGR